MAISQRSAVSKASANARSTRARITSVDAHTGSWMALARSARSAPNLARIVACAAYSAAANMAKVTSTFAGRTSSVEQAHAAETSAAAVVNAAPLSGIRRRARIQTATYTAPAVAARAARKGGRSTSQPVITARAMAIDKPAVYEKAGARRQEPASGIRTLRST